MNTVSNLTAMLLLAGLLGCATMQTDTPASQDTTADDSASASTSAASAQMTATAGATAQDPSTRHPLEGLQFPEPRPFSIPEVERFEFNGIEFFLLHNPELPLVSLQVVLQGGSWMDPHDKAGLAGLTGSVWRSGGSVQYPDEELNELLESRAASMETSFGLTSGSASLSVLSDDFSSLLPVFTDFLANPLFPEQRLDLERMRQLTAITRRNENPGPVANREFRKLIYGAESVYARSTEIATLQNITRDDLVDFHGRVVQGSGMVVGVTGDFDQDRIHAQLREAFGGFEEHVADHGELPEVEYTFEEGLYFAHKGDMTQSQIRLGHIAGFRDNPDYAALQVLNEILSGGFSGRLLQEVRTRQGLAYSVFGMYSSGIRFPGIFYAGLSTAAENTEQAVQATLHEIRRLQQERVSEQELEQTKERIFNRIIFRYDSYGRILSEQLSNHLNGLPADAFDQYISEVQQVQVDDIYRVANEYLNTDALKVLIVGNRDLIADQLESMGPYTEVDLSIPMPGQAMNQ